jgi:hypothetical protein
VELVPGRCDNWGRSVDAVDVAPERAGPDSWAFTHAAAHGTQGTPTAAAADRRRTVREDELPAWAVRIFEEHCGLGGGAAKL